jgi:hypothetical protein
VLPLPKLLGVERESAVGGEERRRTHSRESVERTEGKSGSFAIGGRRAPAAAARWGEVEAKAEGRRPRGVEVLREEDGDLKL